MNSIAKSNNSRSNFTGGPLNINGKPLDEHNNTVLIRQHLEKLINLIDSMNK
ncbi:hypothetical protein [Limosilactobacillus albertensis]|uniref:hypothetical protein n=1 Tax=Limosilactobacillus albertensis TaxID=2759752 RepID=UPI001E40A76F|nr:hypothetical protein [Limosilactobacillus albertensis]